MNGATTRITTAVKTFSKNANMPSVLGSPKRMAKPLPPPGGGNGTGGVIQVRNGSGITTSSGAYLSSPGKVPMGLSAVTATMATGLLIGAGISKNIASFLEENELFVPSDDDDDD